MVPPEVIARIRGTIHDKMMPWWVPGGFRRGEMMVIASGRQSGKSQLASTMYKLTRSVTDGSLNIDGRGNNSYCRNNRI